MVTDKDKSVYIKAEIAEWMLQCECDNDKFQCSQMFFMAEMANRKI